MNVLYISYDGMTDPLGQSQVIPYLEGLSKEGYVFTLISFEKPAYFLIPALDVLRRLEKSNIRWLPLIYTKKPPVLSTLWDLWKMRRYALKMHREKNFKIVHCRSYIAALVGLMMKRKFGLKFIFDMRGFYADERVEGGLWPLSNPVYKAVYRFFKKKEKTFLREADYTISLTQKAKDIIHQWRDIPGQPVPIGVIPCCADLNLFSPKNISAAILDNLKIQFEITGNEFVLMYLGSIGTWYMLDEMLDFFKCLLEKRPDAKFLFVTCDDITEVLVSALKKDIPLNAFLFDEVPHDEVPVYLALANCCIFFVNPGFSKKASSPTKQGEIMGMGIPHICNAGIGDVEDIVDAQSGIVIKQFNTAEYQRVAERILSEKFDSAHIRQKAIKIYSLEAGVAAYAEVYKQVFKEQA